jgi:hypothetical protein
MKTQMLHFLSLKIHTCKKNLKEPSQKILNFKDVPVMKNTVFVVKKCLEAAVKKRVLKTASF